MKQTLKQSPKQNLRNNFRNYFLTSLLLILFSNRIEAQNSPANNVSVCLSGNTGVNVVGNTASLLPPNSNDPHWTVGTISAPWNTTGAQAITFAPSTLPGTCLGLAPNSSSPPNGWITMPGWNCGGVAGNYSCVTSSTSDLYFKLTFNLTTTMYYINWQLFASDYIADIKVNGVSAINGVAAYTTTAPTSYPLQRQYPISFAWCSDWKIGRNEIEVHVKTWPGSLSECKIGGLRVISWCGSGNYVNLSGPSFLCASTAAQYTSPSAASLGLTGTGVKYIWTKPSGWGLNPPISTTSNLYNVQAGQQSGMIGVSILTITPNGYGCLYTGGYNVTVPPPLTITPTSPTVCVGNAITLTASGAVTYNWYAGSSLTPFSTSNPVVVTPAVGSNVYKLKGGGTGCVYTKTVLITGFAKPNVSAILNPTVICAGQTASLNVYGNGWQYWMSHCSLPTSTCAIFANGPTVLVSQPATAIYTITAKTVAGCTQTTAVTLSVNPNPIVTAVANPAVVCPGGASQLTASGANTYQWLPVGGGQNPKTVTPSTSTTYTLKGFVGSCTGSTTVNVGVLPVPTVVVNPPVVCSGIPNILTATGALSYNWTVSIAGSPTVIPNTPIISINSTAAIQVTVCGSGPSNACISCTTLNIPLGSPIPISVPNVTLCTNAGPCTTISASSTVSPVNYTWSSVGTGTFGTGTSAIVCPTVATIYTVSASSPSTGCPSSATMAVSIVTNCCSQSTTGLTQIAALTGSMNNTSYLLNSSMTLSSSTFFYNSEVWITPGVAITVPSGMQLDLDKTHLFACGVNMWQGIIVQDGGRITAVNTRTANSMIEDAIVAIDLDQISLTNSSPNPPIEISRVIFNRNYIGIKISNSAPTLTSLPLGITGCLFTSRSLTYTTFLSPPLVWPKNEMLASPGALRAPLSPTTGIIPPYTAVNAYALANLKQPYSNQPGHIGVKIENIGVTNGNVTNSGVEFGITHLSPITYDYNFFEGIGNGIDVTDASLTTLNNVFQNLQTYSTSSSPLFGGVGIKHVITPTLTMNARLDMRASGVIPANHFWDCNIGVNTSNVFECWIDNSVFRSTQSVTGAFVPPSNIKGGIGVNNETNRFDFTVKHCEFNNVRKGIVLHTPLSTLDYELQGLPPTPGIYAAGLEFSENYFGPEVKSTTPYSSSSANTSEYMSDAIEVQTPNTFGWFFPGAIANYGNNSFIISNKINRVFRGISVDGFEDNGLVISTNSIVVEDDQTYPGTPQFGISAQNKTGNLVVLTNTVESSPWFTNLTSSVSALYFYNNSGVQSPIVSCNSETNAYYGFQFDGNNANTDWNGNIMCTNFAGLALTNTAVIGAQGSPTMCSNNMWSNDPSCGIWGTGPSPWCTYCENSNPTLSPLYVTNNMVNNPAFLGPFNSNNSGSPFPFPFYDFGSAPQSLDYAPTHQPDCNGYAMTFNPPPSWRSAHTSSVSTLKDELYESKISVYPNPTNSRITISGQDKDDNLTVRIFDLAGKLVFNADNLKGSANELDLSELDPSIYMIEVKSESGKTIRKKLVKTD